MSVEIRWAYQKMIPSIGNPNRKREGKFLMKFPGQRQGSGRALKFKLTLSCDAIRGEMTHGDERPGARAGTRLELKRETP